MERYKHTQIGLLTFTLLATGLGLIGGLMLVQAPNDFVLLVTASWIVCLLLFGSLTVTIDGDKLKVRFGVGVIRITLRLPDVATYQVVTNPWYYGWGIKLIPGGWLFNISGLSAVELRMKNGRRYRVGTDDAEGLMRAIEGALLA